MPFEVALVLSLLVHLALFTGIQIVWLFKFKPKLDYRPHFFPRVAFALFFWVSCIEAFDGCPFTLVENAASKWVYGEPFYPDYSKHDTVVYHLLP